MTLGNADRINGFWSHSTMFLAGIVVTLVGAWATHSVTKDDLAAAINNSERVQNLKIETISNGQKELLSRIEDLRRDLQGSRNSKQQ